MSSDTQAIKYLHETLALQKAAFLKDQYPTAEERKSRLNALAGAIMAHKDDMRAALKADFGGNHPDGITDVFEVAGMAGRAAYVVSQVDKWMEPRKAEVDPQQHGNGTAEIHREPKGVVGVLVPFNFPSVLSMGPLCEILAAGNRAILKPSEFTPKTGAVLKKVINAAFPRDLVEVVEGGVELGVEFSKQPWNHLLYTGSSPVGKIVMAAAAKNLVPVTLELGGKSPVFLGKGSVNEDSVTFIITTKLVKSGQLCVTPDTIYVLKSELENFLNLSKKYLATMPGYSKSEDACGLIHDRHFDRLIKMKEDAVKSGARVEDIEVDAKADKATRRMPLAMVVDGSEDLSVTKEEIFGPLLNVRTVDSLHQAVDHANTQERPLAVYIWSNDEEEIDYVIKNTKSGGVSVNSIATQAAINSLGFGGVGNSGMGRHQGWEGFMEFSNPKGIFRRGTQPVLPWGPPYRTFEAISQQIFGGGSPAQ